MNIFCYDASFEGFLTVVFESYRLKIVPDKIVEEAEVLPLFSDNVLHISADEQKAQRVWKGLKKKLSPAACSMISVVFLADDPSIPMLLFRYIRKAIDAPKSIETNFGGGDVLEAAKWYKKVGREAERVRQFVRFQKTEDDIFFAPVAPLHNVLPLAVEHFADRFSDQKWLVYDTRRKYGFFYDPARADLQSACPSCTGCTDCKSAQAVVEVTFDHLQINPRIGTINPDMMAEDESLFQQMWKAYFKSMTIKERINPKLHRQNMPRRFWRYLTEKQ